MKMLMYISFDGSDYVGYQAQKNGNSIQHELNRAAEEIFGVRCDITGCSRTDSGVHAHMFCATVEPHDGVEISSSITSERLPFAMNSHLPDSISVVSAKEVGADFHARYSVVSKEYLYRIYNSPIRDPFEIGRSWHLSRIIDNGDLEKMKTAASYFIGEMDFASCMAAGSKVKDTVRNVYEAEVEREGSVITFRVRANGFLYNMVRIMTGTLVDVAYSNINVESIPGRLSSLDRALMGRTAPSEGLYLNRVFYE